LALTTKTFTRCEMYSLNILGSFLPFPSPPIAMLLHAPPKNPSTPGRGPYTEVLQVVLGDPAFFGTQYQGSVVEVVSSASLYLVQRWIMAFLRADRKGRIRARCRKDSDIISSSFRLLQQHIIHSYVLLAGCGQDDPAS